MKRLYLRLVALRANLLLFFAEIDADDAVRISREACEEHSRATGWQEITAGKLASAQRDHARAVQAIERHDRHRELGIAS